MKRGNKLIDKETGRLKCYVVQRIYDYCGMQAKQHSGYVRISYGVLAQHVGLPWIWAGSDNAHTITLLYAALRRLERYGLIRMKTDIHTMVLVLLRVSPKRLYRYGHDTALFRFEPR